MIFAAMGVMFDKVGKILRTVIHLKPIQFFFQIKYRILKPRKLSYYSLDHFQFTHLLFFEVISINKIVSINETKKICFNYLNLVHEFEERVNWNFDGYGKLWNYNLQYLDFLKQSDLSISLKSCLLKSCYIDLWNGELLLEPYPASIRIMNTIRFVCENVGISEGIYKYVKAEANFLSRRLEYHLLANHLLENAFALYMAGCFFQEIKWQKLGEKLILRELDEQILDDGAHFELSPMYHQIILFRILEAINYLQPCDPFHSFLAKKAGLMIAWLKNISFEDGSIPHFNDSCDGIAFGTYDLMKIAKLVGIDSTNDLPLQDSGYRKFKANDFELVADFHGISPSYQPGHAHADTFSICLNHKGKEILVDPGISTYNISPRRDWERSTNAHNTVEVGGMSSSEMWAGFRVGRRANVKILEESEERTRAMHDGFRQFGILVERSISVDSSRIIINDTISNLIDKSVFLHLHLHPNINLVRLNDRVFLINGNLRFEFEGEGKVEVENYQFCSGYNQYFESKRFKIEINCCSFTTTITNQ